MGRCALALCGLCGLCASGVVVDGSLAVFGYVPEYRFGAVDWPHIVASTTHVVLFSVEPSPSGNLVNMDRLTQILSDGSPLRRSLAAAGSAPKVLVSIGGAGRSRHYAAAAGSSKTRKKFASAVAMLLGKHPLLAGVDLDWEQPTSEEQWRDLGKLANEIRGAMAEHNLHHLLTMTYHPRSGAVQAFSQIRGKKSDKPFVDLFDFCHAMAYSQYDADRRHSSSQMDAAAIDEWVSSGLPAPRLTLGLPFFGISRKTGEAKAWGQILDQEPSLRYRPGVDELSDGTYFVGARSLHRKVSIAASRGLGGVMIWELGHDKPAREGNDLLRHVWAARAGEEPAHTWREFAYTQAYGLRGDHAFGLAAAVLGAYYLLQVLSFPYPRNRHCRPSGAPWVRPATGPEPVSAQGEE